MSEAETMTTKARVRFMLLAGVLLLAAGAVMTSGCTYQKTYGPDGQPTGVQVVVSATRKNQALKAGEGTIATDGSGWVEAHRDFGSNVRQAYESETTRLGLNLAGAYFGMEQQLRDQSGEVSDLRARIENLEATLKALGGGPRTADGVTTGTE